MPREREARRDVRLGDLGRQQRAGDRLRRERPAGLGESQRPP